MSRSGQVLRDGMITCVVYSDNGQYYILQIQRKAPSIPTQRYRWVVHIILITASNRTNKLAVRTNGKRDHVTKAFVENESTGGCSLLKR